jgi:alpha-D-xyloside xylohydrolase
MYKRLALLLSAVVACGDDVAPVPEVIEEGDLRVQSDPLRLIVGDPADPVASVAAFVEVATVSAADPTRYYDPRDLSTSLQWQAATRIEAWDTATGTATLDNGVTLRLEPGPIGAATTLVVDAGAVPEAVLVRLLMPRDPTEPIYGFGESFVSAEAGGTVREMQLRVDTASESGLNEVHAPVPLALWPGRGLGLFVEDPRAGAFDVGAARADRVLATFTLTEPGPMHAHVYTAATPIDLVREYIAMTALPAVPPKWAFAPQQWRNAHNSSQEVRDDAHAMRDLDIPGSTMWIDNPWQTAYNDFIFDETRFDEPQALLDELESLGYRVLVWSTPYVNRDGPTAGDFAEAREAGYLVTDGVQPLVFPWQDGPGALVDFTAPGATEWWRERIARVTDMGISGFKLDFGEEVLPELGGNIPPITLHGGSTSIMQSRYTWHYHEAYLGALPPGDGFLITRAGTYGDQAVNTCIWPGDLDSDFSLHGVDNGEGQINVGGLPAAVAAGLSLSVSGYPFFGSDIGGFRDGPTSTETLIRWSQYAALGTIMQLGGGGRSHNPWDTELFDPPALEVYQTYSRLHMLLVPHLYTLALQAGADGTPVTIPTRFVYPEAASDDATFLFGDVLFVAPVIEEGATSRVVVLPPGRWIGFWDGAVDTGDGTTEITAPAPLETLPLWRRSNTFLAMFARYADTLEPATAAKVTSYADPAYGRELRLLITPESDEARIELHDGTTATGAEVAGTYELTATPGDEFDIVTFELDTANSTVAALAPPGAVTFDGAALDVAADAGGLATCPAPGCAFDDGAGRLLVRVHLDGESTVRIAAP